MQANRRIINHAIKALQSQIKLSPSTWSQISDLARTSRPAFGLASPQTRHISGFLSERRLAKLQTDADSNPHNATTQAEYLKALNDSDPEAVIRRFESQSFASNEACTLEYVRALSALNRLNLSTFGMKQQAPSGYSQSSTFTQSPPRTEDPWASQYYNPSMQQAMPPPSSSFPGASIGLGTTPTSPVHIQFVEKTGGGLWRTIRSIAIAFIVITGLGVLFEEKGGSIGKGAAASRLSSMGMVQEYKPIVETNKTFEDVKGCDEAKGELQEIVEFLKDPKKFTRLGGKLPKGVLLVGPPGTGKTLLAKAIAGEAGVPFFYCSGSEFEEMFVGVGARRVRELFASAKKRSPCIIFIDEIDAVGAKRNPKDQQYMRMTLNQLLAELDGFNSADGIIVIGATNFAQALDQALVRPGRFDRHVVVPPPDVEGRTQILELHMKNVPKGKDVNARTIARGTPGFCGADLANLVNVAALKASMDNKTEVTMSDLEFAKDRIMMGAERKSAKITPESMKNTAYHEGGHALVAALTDGALPIHKATVVPRGQALGMVQQLPEKDLDNYTLKQLTAMLDVCMGGRVAEEVIFGAKEVTTGAVSDIQQATNIARNMVTKYGMSESLGPVFYAVDKFDENSSTSPEFKRMTDDEVKKLVEGAYTRAKTMLTTHEKTLHALAQALIEKETLTGPEIKDIIERMEGKGIFSRLASRATSTTTSSGKQAAQKI